jgi:hypothetical protein
MYVDYSVFYGGMRDLEHISWEPLQRHTINNYSSVEDVDIYACSLGLSSAVIHRDSTYFVLISHIILKGYYII